MVKLGLVAAAGLSIMFISPAFSEQAPTCEGSKDACQQISDLSKEHDAAFNKHDVAAVVGMFTPDAADVGEGVMLSGGEQIGFLSGPGRREAALGQAQRSCRSITPSTSFKCSASRIPLRCCISSTTRARHSAWHA